MGRRMSNRHRIDRMRAEAEAMGAPVDTLRASMAVSTRTAQSGFFKYRWDLAYRDSWTMSRPAHRFVAYR